MTIRAGLFEAVDAAGVRTFGELVTITYHDGTPSEQRDAVWHAPGERVELVDGIPVASVSPAVGIHLADWARAPERGDTITRAGVVYEIGERIPDGHGGMMVELVLPRA